MERPVTAALCCGSYTDAERQHLFRLSRLFITCYYLYVTYYGLFVLDMSRIDHPMLHDLGPNWWMKCVSVWNLVLQISYFLYCTIFVDFADSKPGNTWKQPRFEINRKIRDFLFISLVFPITIEVCCMFWAIQAVNKQLLVPADMINWIPDWYNHAVHTNPLVFTLFEVVSGEHRLPKMGACTAGLFALSGSYVACLLYNKFTAGLWVYLIIGEIVTSPFEVIAFFAVTAFIMPFLCMTIGYKLCLWFSIDSRTTEKRKIS